VRGKEREKEREGGGGRGGRKGTRERWIPTSTLDSLANQSPQEPPANITEVWGDEAVHLEVVATDIGIVSYQIRAHTQTNTHTHTRTQSDNKHMNKTKQTPSTVYHKHDKAIPYTCSTHNSTIL
jgi:hypothetical protein